MSRPGNLTTGPSWMALFNDPEATRRRFPEVFAKLAHRLPPDDGPSSIVEHDHKRLMRHPLRTYETANLKFLQAEIGSPTPQADIVRSFNVLMYFDGDFRHRADQWVATVLHPVVCSFAVRVALRKSGAK